jgi:hypothetical protein
VNYESERLALITTISRRAIRAREREGERESAYCAHSGLFVITPSQPARVAFEFVNQKVSTGALTERPFNFVAERWG